MSETPRTDAMQRIQFEGYTCIVAAPEDIEELELEFRAAKERIAQLRAELERERVRLAACGVAAMGNTREALERNRLEPGSYGHSASYDDCLRAAEREIELRERIAQLTLPGEHSELLARLQEEVDWYAEEASDHSTAKTCKEAIAALEQLQARVRELELVNKNLAPIGKYNGLDIEEWYKRAEQAEARLAEYPELVLAHLHNLIGDLPRYEAVIAGSRYGPHEIEYERARDGANMDSEDVDKLVDKLRELMKEEMG